MSALGPVAQARLQALVSNAQRAGRLPTLVAAIASREGELVWSSAVGAGVSQGGTDTQYRLGSITKTMTAVLVMQAVRDGLLSLDGPLAQVLPRAPFADRSLRALLSHSAGLPSEPLGPWWERTDGTDFDALAAAQSAVEPVLASGAQFHYSNLGYGLLGEAVAQARGESWWELIQQRLLRPLEMTRTTYFPEAPHATGYSVDYLLSTLHPEPSNDTGAMAPVGQLWCTLADLARWSAFVQSGHPDVLDRDLLAAMLTPNTPGGGYGLGFQLAPGPAGTLVGHTGTMPGFMAKMQIDRGHGLAALLLANGTVGMETLELGNALLEVAAEPEPVSVPAWEPAEEVPAPVRDIVGRWHWGYRAYDAVWLGDVLELRAVQPAGLQESFTLRDGEWVDSLGVALDVHRAGDRSIDAFRFDTYLFTREPSARA